MTFEINPLPQDVISSMVAKKVWQEACPVSLDELSLVTIKHYDFAGEIRQGQLVVNSSMASNALSIFKELFELKFPIAKMVLIDEYNGDDNASMADNNSSCFNYRRILTSEQLSMHSYGLAIDINPVQNPYIVINKESNEVQVFPKTGTGFLNRHNYRGGMVEPIVAIFEKYGFNIWGGKWNELIDYHHFQVDIPRS